MSKPGPRLRRPRESFPTRRPRWLITHEHESVPFLMDGSFQAAIELKP